MRLSSTKGRGAMNFLLAILSASAHSVNSVSLRLYQTKFQKSVADLRLYQGLVMLLAAILYWVLNDFSLKLETAGLLLALCYGLDLVLTGITVSICYQCGPMSLTSVISNACVVLPIADGCIFYNERLNLNQIIGCVLLFITFVLPCFERTSGSGKISWKWFPLILLAFFFNGMGAVLLNIYGRVADAAGRNAYLSIGYFTCALLYLVISLFHHKRMGLVPGKGFFSPLLALVLVCSALGSFLGNGILMALNIRMPATILYPMVNGGIGVLVAIVSCTVFKEKLTVRIWTGIVIGIAAIILIAV